MEPFFHGLFSKSTTGSGFWVANFFGSGKVLDLVRFFGGLCLFLSGHTVCCVLFRPVRKLVACGFSKSIWSNYPFQTLTIWSQSNSRGVIKSFSLTGGVNKHNTWIITYHKFNMSEEQQPCPTDKSPSTDGEIDKISPSRTGPRFILPKGVALKFHLCFCKVWKLSIIIT